MSYAQAFFQGVAIGAINALGAMAFGATGGVVLGNFSFAGMEVPEFITIGGTQKHTMHSLPGGERIVDLLGHDDHDLEWSGILIDTFQGTPTQRAQQLDQMRINGQAMPLQWGNWYYTVLVTEFRAETRYSQLHYRIRCLVLVNPAAPRPQPQPQTQDAVDDDLGEAQSAAPEAVKPSVRTAQATSEQSLPEPPLSPSDVDAGRVDIESQGLETTTGQTVATQTQTPPTSAGYVDEYGRVQNQSSQGQTVFTDPSSEWAPQGGQNANTPTSPPYSDPFARFGPRTGSPPATATVGTDGGLMPPATQTQ